jgi:hypothetical protein
MDKLKLELNKPAEGALKFAKAKRGESKIPGKGDWFMYSLVSGEVLFIDSDDCQDPDEMFASANIEAHAPFTICLRKSRQGARYLEVKALSDAQEPALEPRRYPDEQGNVQPTPSKLESQLAASIDQVQRRKAVTPQCAPSVAAKGAMSTPPQPQQPNRTTLPTVASSTMASAMIAAFDACRLFEQYAASKGVVATFGPQDYRAVANTIYMAACEDARSQRAETPAFAQFGDAQPWRQ